MPANMIALPALVGRISDFARRLRRETRAVAMIETAFTIPTLLFTSFAGLEIANLMITHTKVSALALAAADNASRIAAGSNLAQPQVREVDVNDVFTGSQLQSGSLDLKAHGRIILSSLETNIQGGQWIHWQRCYGDRPYGSSYGKEGQGLTGTTFAGMGATGKEVRASPGAPVMFVEVFYDYAPFMFASWIGSKGIRYTAAFNVRDARDTSQIYNPAPAALRNTCGTYNSPYVDDGNNGHGNNENQYDPSNPGNGGGGGGS